MPRSRRRFSDEEKKLIVDEAVSSSNFAETARKHKISTAHIYRWKTEYDGRNELNLEPHESSSNVTDESLAKELANSLNRLDRIDKTFTNLLIDRLHEDLVNKRISAYNASIAMSNLFNAIVRSSDLKYSMRDRLKALRPILQKGAKSKDDFNSEAAKLAEQLMLQYVGRRKIRTPGR